VFETSIIIFFDKYFKIKHLFGLKKDGSEVPIEIGLNPLQIDEKIFVLASIIDITERKNEQARLSLVVEASSVAMLLANQEHEIVFANAQCATLFGYSKQEMMGAHINLLIPERFHAKHDDQTKNFMQNPHGRPMESNQEFFGRKKDGTEIPLDISLSPIKTDQGFFVAASMVDVTERKRKRFDEFKNYTINKFQMAAYYDGQNK
jgi:PAS domain S-box-containing protein